MMFPAENIRDWRGENLVDASGNKVGSVEAIYFDTSTDDAVFASVQTGIVGRHKLTFVPLYGAVVAPSYVKVTADKKTIKDAPSIETDGELTSDLEPDVFAHYGLTYQPGANGERRLGRR